MKAADIKIMQEISQEVVDLMPTGLMVDGNKNFFMKGKQESIVNVLTLITEAKTKATELNAIIQDIEGRKSNNQ